MTNREMFLFATTILFASTTAGLVLKGALCHHHMRPGFERMGGPEGMRGPRDGHGPKFDMFAETDTNKDGFVTKDEMLAGQQKRLDEFFATVDTNHDGKLSKDEMEKGRELMRARFEAKRKAAEATQAGAPVPADPDAPTPAADQSPTTAQ